MARPVAPDLRPRVLEAATRVFAAHGFHGASMAAIGAAAEVTKGGVYFHFRSKEELFFAALDHWRREFRGARRTALAAAGDGAAALRAGLAAHFAQHFARPDAGRLLRVLAAELRDRFTAAVREDARAEWRALRADLRDALTLGNRDGTLFTPDPVVSAFLLAGAAQGVIDQWLTAPADVAAFCDPDGLAEGLVAPYGTGRSAGARAATDDAADDAMREFRPPL